MHEVHGRESRTPRVIDLAAGFPRDIQKVNVLQCDRFGRALAVFVYQNELDVHGIGMAQGNRGLHPLKQNLELAAKGVGSGFKLAEILHARTILQWL
jgi:hypothetical protein